MKLRVEPHRNQSRWLTRLLRWKHAISLYFVSILLCPKLNVFAAESAFGSWAPVLSLFWKNYIYVFKK
jgi:hypothetical protein